MKIAIENSWSEHKQSKAIETLFVLVKSKCNQMYIQVLMETKWTSQVDHIFKYKNITKNAQI